MCSLCHDCLFSSLRHSAGDKDLLFLSSLFGNKAPKRFVTEQAFQQNTGNQVEGSAETLEALYSHGVKPTDSKSLEFFFYTNHASKADALTAQLVSMGYKAANARSEDDKNLYLITGRTTPVQMTESAIRPWTMQMCQIGFTHDADFDGWGTEV